ncbi:hypothetical protein AALP_AA6G241200 [Arabis alpina]|uniref:Uncharacterized protein n=1 Tax=Arabis alpina TaxID=50452 RepID=A0A087GRD2_ARAAL|nr:hypothetical protein AALP_AA6G241200 [Arabis alpina]
MRGAAPGIHAFNTPSILIRTRKSRRLSEVSNRSDVKVTADPSAIVVIQDSEDNTEGISLPNQEENEAVRDGSQKVSSATDLANMQRADDASARGSVLDKLNEPKGLGDAPRSKGKGKVDPIDKKAEKKRIAVKAKADLEAGRIPAFRIGGTFEVLPSEAPVAQILGITPPAYLPVNSDIAAILPYLAVQTAVNVPQPPPPRAPLTRRGTQISLEKMVEAEYKLPPGLLENSAKEEGEYLAKSESFDIDSLGDNILFPTLSPPLIGPPRDVASQVSEGISEHGWFLSPQDIQDGDQV